MLLECDNCGAPFDISDKAKRAKCNYCGTAVRAEKFHKVAEHTPEGWKPPEKWTPPAHSQLAGQSLAYKPIRVIGRMVWLAISFGTFALVGGVVWRVLAAVNHATNALATGAQSAELQGAINNAIGTMTQQINAAAQAAGEAREVGGNIADGPVTCSGVDSITITGKTLQVAGTNVPVTATGNCRVKIVGSRLSGGSAIVARDNARVSVEGGALTGAKAAVTLSGNAALEVTGGTMLTGGPALAASGNSKATLRSASVNGAVDTRENASVDAVGAKLLGPVTGTRRVKK
jgi:hypothetical protein